MSNDSDILDFNSYELVWTIGIHRIAMNPKLTSVYCLPLSKYFLFVQIVSFNPTNYLSLKVVSACYLNNVFSKLQI